MNRTAPSLRPSGQSDGSQQWRDLLFLHWPVPIEALRAVLPPDVEVDTFEGEAFIGLVPFEMKRVKPWFLPGPGMNFLEANVRTYVHHKGDAPGVWFFSLDAASWLAVQAARLGWSLPYYYATMNVVREGSTFNYQSRRSSGPQMTCRYRRTNELGTSIPGTLQHFFLERYLLYTMQKGQLVRGQVHHPPYPAYEAELIELEENLCDAAGVPVEGPPPYVHASPGVDVEVFGIEPV